MTGKKPTSYSESTLSDRYQTTIPEPICKVLGLNKCDKIGYTIEPDGKVVVSRVNQIEGNPVLGQFLNFLARNMQKNPQHIHAISSDLASSPEAPRCMLLASATGWIGGQRRLYRR